MLVLPASLPCCTVQLVQHLPSGSRWLRLPLLVLLLRLEVRLLPAWVVLLCQRSLLVPCHLPGRRRDWELLRRC